MFFRIEHTTEYAYPEPATEAFTELRLRPRDSLRQAVSFYSTRITPAVLVDTYTDYFGNYIETVSIPFRHQQLTVTSTCEVTTQPQANALNNLALTVCEARLLYRSRLREIYDFVRPSTFIPLSPKLAELADQLLPETGDFAAGIHRINEWIHDHVRYTPGVTDVNTSAADLLCRREGVCQDFAHLMIGLCRIAGIPARYVSGYIETEPASDPALLGATASHAWVEVLCPNGFWVGLDPTNRMLEGVRHVQIGVGRDYADVPPLKGTFKGPDRQVLNVAVRVTRNELTAAAARANASVPVSDRYVAEYRTHHDVSLRPSGSLWPAPADDSHHRGS